MSSTYDEVTVDRSVVMPNHIHLIIVISAESGDAQFAPTISRVVKQFKGSISKQIGYSIWQKSYHDHIIQNEAEHQNIRRYIDENPDKWTEDEYYCGNDTEGTIAQRLENEE